LLITSNRSVAEWGTVFADPVVATAILDRLLHHSHVLTSGRDSYRLRDKRKRGLIKPFRIAFDTPGSTWVEQHRTLAGWSKPYLNIGSRRILVVCPISRCTNRVLLATPPPQALRRQPAATKGRMHGHSEYHRHRPNHAL
jgi:hypothetical protein